MNNPGEKTPHNIVLEAELADIWEGIDGKRLIKKGEVERLQEITDAEYAKAQSYDDLIAIVGRMSSPLGIILVGKGSSKLRGFVLEQLHRTKERKGRTSFATDIEPGALREKLLELYLKNRTQRS
ncbi:hypothetical protein D4R49_00015 [bacterium]|nr:MAG: hypothetical protein D4R49_00015 [bacterium]